MPNSSSEFPPAFIEHAKRFAGEEFGRFLSSLSEDPPVSIRLNPYKKKDVFSEEERISWSKEGRYLAKRPSFTLDPLFHAGCYYVQEASSQFLEIPFQQARSTIAGPVRVLDLCAAPGGKSTHLLSLLREDDLLVSNEVVPNRNAVLRDNISKWGCANVIVTQNNPGDFTRLQSAFDVVVVDAPCSGEGLFRKDKDALAEWSVDNVKMCSLRQREILKHAFSALRPEGFLIYSTCTFEESENDLPVEMLIREYGMISREIVPADSNVVKTKYGLSFFPHRIRGEGFYLALLQKGPGITPGKRKRSGNQVNISRSNVFSEYLADAEKFTPYQKEDRLFAIPCIHFEKFLELSGSLYIRLAGIHLGEVKGSLIPSGGLALSNHLHPGLERIDLSYDKAIEYLRGGHPEIAATPGWKIMCFRDHPLGWVKHLGKRMNNYYPKEWRIKMESKRQEKISRSGSERFTP